jgi:phenylalanyl-tRNA synthetase beta chain
LFYQTQPLLGKSAFRASLLIFGPLTLSLNIIMKISYNWLEEFIHDLPSAERLSAILTAVGLEVEKLEKFEEIKGSLNGLIVGEVLECAKHPQADKLQVTKVDVGNDNLQIVCGATNISVGQKVVVAPVGCIISPVNAEHFTIKKATIRGVESYGMICAEDEIGIGNNHEGILVLPGETKTGSSVSDYFKPYTDWIFEIGLTPNRMDAMSHFGVAKDVYAYLLYHDRKDVKLQSPFSNGFRAGDSNSPVDVIIENSEACQRYAGVTIANIQVRPSPAWMQSKLKAIGLRPINNIVDITNYILHEAGQPLHAFDADEIKGNKILVKNLPEGTLFVTLDGKERKLHAEDLMICNGAEEPICFGGVFGGLHAGVKNTTTNIFLESAWFNPAVIRSTSIRHSLRTDAAIRFEKGVDISRSVDVLKRAANMIKEIAGGEIASDVIDVYPEPKPKASVILKDNYLQKLSGKNFERQTVKSILQSLSFEISNETPEALNIAVPYSKPDITLPADIVEEIMRIDGYDNVEIPSAITIAPSNETGALKSAYKEKIAGYLTGAGFSEIFTNSITNSSHYTEPILVNSVKIINSLSVDLDIMRPSLKETGLECIAYNLNRKNNDLLFFEFGNSYSINEQGNYNEKEHLCLYISGNRNEFSWKNKPIKTDFFFLKGICENIFSVCGLTDIEYSQSEKNGSQFAFTISANGNLIGDIKAIDKNKLDKFSIKQLVLYADFNWQNIIELAKKITIEYTEIPKFPAVHRDLAIVLNKNISYSQVEKTIQNLKINRLVNLTLFDVFESEKIGVDKKSYAISFTFVDKEKTLTDKEIDAMMNRIIQSMETTLNAEIRK